MGGYIGVTIREENGNQHSMGRWTNPLPYFFKNLKFFKKDKKYLAQYLKQKRGKELKAYDFLAPVEYGLVVIDYHTNTVLYANHYSNMITWDFASIWMDMREEDLAETIKELCVDNRFIGYTKYEKIKNKYVCKTINKAISFEELSQMIKERDFENKGHFILDSSPWIFKRFDDSKNGFLKLKKEIIKLGFKLSSKEKELWNVFSQEKFSSENKN